MLRRLLLYCSAVLMTPTAAAVSQVMSASIGTDLPAGVSEVLARFDSVREGGGGSLFADNAVFVNEFGGQVQSRAAMDSTLAAMYGTPVSAGAKVERIDRKARILSPDLVVVDNIDRLSGQKDARGRNVPPRTIHSTLILRQQQPRDWRIVYYRAGDDRNLNLENQQRVTIDALENDWANLARYRDDNAKLPPPARGENRVVFYGNSITDVWAKDFPTMFPGKPYIGRGISGQTTPQMLVRFNQDVVALKPKVVVILAGTNDIAGNTGPSTLEMIEDNLRSMTEIAKANGIRVVLSSVLPVFDYAWRPGLEPAPKIIALNAWMKQYAAKSGAVYLDYHTPMKDARNGLRADLTNDGVHPTEAGYRVMAPLAEKAIQEALRR